MDYFTQQNHAIICRYGGELLRIEAWGRGLRIRAAMMQETEENLFALLPGHDSEAVISLEGNTASIKNGSIEARLNALNGTGNCEIAFFREDGRMLLREIGRQDSLKHVSRLFRSLPGGNYEITASFQADPEEKLFGMGQYQQEVLNLKNCTLELAQRNSQASVPFVVSDRGYGFLWNNPAIGRATFAKNETRWEAENSRQIDYWIVAGSAPSDILKDYGEVTGTVPMMPEYGMGFWQCKLRYWNQEQLLKVAREYRKRQIPLDVIVVDFFHWPQMGDFRFEEEFFPDPSAMVRELDEMGIKLMVSVWPQVSPESENYKEMHREGFLVKAERGIQTGMRFGGESMFFDATNPGTGNYVWNKCRQNYFRHGIELFWLDEAEPEYETYDYDNYRYYMGPVSQVGNIYPLMFSKIFYEGMKEEGKKKIMNLVRCAWAGSQRYGALVWSGDVHSNWESFRKQLCAGLNMGMAGIPWWTTDIGGFYGGRREDENFRELLIRWFEWAAFCPVMRLHGDRQPDIPVFRKDGSQALFTGMDNEIWSFGEENAAIMEKYIRLRQRMRPYISEIMEEAHVYGWPVMRTMFFEFPQDERCWELQDQYMFGADMLVAPVMEKGAREREIYLPPEESWVSLSDGRCYDGGQIIKVQAGLDKIPVFLRNGKHSEWVGSI